MTIAGFADCRPEAYQTNVASGIRTSKERQARMFLSYIRKLPQQPRVFWVMPDSEAAVVK